MQKQCGKEADRKTVSERGKVEAPWWKDLQAASAVARDDRDGCSRYRAAKMSAYADELGWYRVFFAPIFG